VKNNMARVPRRRHSDPEQEEAVTQAVTIVSGLPRSGTSMMMQILEAGGIPILTDEVRRADEDNPRGYYEFEAVKKVREDPAWVEGARGKAVKMVYRLLYDLPGGQEYRVVFMRRSLEEVLASQQEMLQRQGKGQDDADLGQLADIYRRQLRDVEAWLDKQPNFSVLYVDYHDVLRKAESVAEELDRFLGGGLDAAAMARVPDRKLHRQRA
jgi:hypothetical protein